jgi:hypothetical protein
VRERRAYTILAIMSVGLSILTVMYCVHLTTSSNHKFCDVVNASVSVPVPKPANPVANPSRERSYEWYVRFKHLDVSLGCEHPRYP